MIMKPIFLTTGLLLLLFTRPALASVSINEVAWMGGTNSANHEWIELHNSGDAAVSVEGWTLKDGLNLNITLVGTIGSGVYAVLERTSEESAAGTAFYIYTGALVNTGTTLVLSGTDGAVIDQVTGGTDWENIGGDNTTKETAQYTASGWVTDVGTPGARNGDGRVEEVILPKEETVTVSKSSSGGSSKISSAAIRLKNPETKMTLLTDIQSIAYVNQKVIFRATANGLNESSSKLIRFEWNFGDSYLATSTKAEHSYSYPGTYVVTVYAKNGKAEQMARHEITVLPVTFSITKSAKGDVQLNNDAPYDTDVSGYLLKGESSITFPARTIIASRSTITIEAARLGSEIEENMIALYDTERNLVASNYTEDYFVKDFALVEEEEVYPVSFGSSLYNNSATTLKEEIIPFNFSTQVAEASEGDISPKTANLDNIDNNEIKDSTKNETVPKWPYLALIGLLLVATGGIFLSKK